MSWLNTIDPTFICQIQNLGEISFEIHHALLVVTCCCDVIQNEILTIVCVYMCVCNLINHDVVFHVKKSAVASKTKSFHARFFIIILSVAINFLLIRETR